MDSVKKNTEIHPDERRIILKNADLPDYDVSAPPGQLGLVVFNGVSVYGTGFTGTFF